ncbi:malectin domain-containing carbohydrate-binding protein [Flavimarina sp. Hel_I_48]|uniref:malectin domain-containing carbohydrate-binding protein n=1 Tax=Flavimarina sp. Hel_I_48 TaxID=1392488 RepID=UPI0004DED1E3|nr:malectin domain-containing carbohydrate-binding protein [Flavimarina sp. Hel_I_48]
MRFFSNYILLFTITVTSFTSVTSFSNISNNPSTNDTSDTTSEIKDDPFVLRINSGGDEIRYGNEHFIKDNYYKGDGKTFKNDHIKDIGNTTRDDLYLTERSTIANKNTFNYAIPVPNGTFKVKLHFAEIYWGSTNGGSGGNGKRVFSATLENQKVLNSLDIIKEVGTMNALQKEYLVTVRDGILNIDFIGSKDQPKLSALEIIEEPEANEPEAIRINTGGPQIEIDGMSFSADSYFNGGRKYTNYGIPAIHDTEKDAIYRSERSTGTGSGGFSYTIPVENGNYKVKCHFAEIYWGATGGGSGGKGKRLINISIENQKRLSDLDIIREVGSETALIKSYSVNVRDGKLNIDLTSTKDEPKISAIEIIKVDPVDDTAVTRINAGSSALVVNGKNFLADTYFTGKTSVFENQQIEDIKNTTEDELYKSERSAGVDKGSFGYAIPVKNGEYRVALHFAEIYWGVPGGGSGGVNKRIFSVNVENKAKLVDLDMIKELGTMTASIKTYSTSVKDGILNIDFSASKDRPKIAAIEVFKENERKEDEFPLMASFNVGGPSLTLNGTVFQKDAYTTGSSKTSTTTFNEIKNTNIQALYKSERSTNNDQGNFSYAFPVTNGTYQVKLHFAELWFGAPKSGPGGIGKRVFNYKLENESAIEGFDITKEVGTGTALTRTYTVNVSDGELNLNFGATVNRPQLCGIQLYGNGELGEEGQDPCAWTELAPSKLKKLEAQSATVGDKLYSFAGFLDNFIITGVTEIYDVKNNTWTTGAPMPFPATHMGKAQVNDDVWLIGGFIGNNPGVATAKVQIYSTSTDSWRAGPSLPAPRGSGAAAYANGKIHFFGGLLPDRTTDVDEHYVLDPENLAAGWIPAAPLPYGRNHLSAATVNGLIYAIGGQYGHDYEKQYLRYLHVYDPATDTWTRKRNLFADRSHFEPCTLVHNGKIIIIGGRRGIFFFDDITEYDPAIDQWTQRCELPERLLAPVAGIFDDKLIVANGGYSESDLRDNTRFLRIEPETTLSTIEEDANLSNGDRFGESITVYPNPTKDNITLTGIGDTERSLEIAVKNINGATLISKKYNAFDTSYTLETSSLQTGIYFVEIVKDASSKKVIKFIKN